MRDFIGQIRYALDLVASVAIAGLTVANIPIPGLTVVLGIATLFFVPGYLLSVSLYPKTESMGTVERLTLSLGLSVIASGLLLTVVAYTFGMEARSTSYSLLALTVLLAVFAGMQRRLIPVSSLFVPRFQMARSRWYEKSRFEKLLLALQVLSIFILISATARLAVVTNYIEPQYTEFFLLDSHGLAIEYPETMSDTGIESITVGVVSHEGYPTSYELYYWSSDFRTIGRQSIQLNDGELWEFDIDISPAIHEGTTKVTFLLQGGNQNSTSRSLYLWLDVNA